MKKRNAAAKQKQKNTNEREEKKMISKLYLTHDITQKKSLFKLNENIKAKKKKPKERVPNKKT